jgi:prepilin-type N-terminal cleavage/methylation domain-containing protein
MKLFQEKLSPASPPSPRVARAFTLAELMTAVAIFSLVVIGLLSLQIFGFKMNAITASKLKSTAYSLKTLNQIRRQVREASSVSVGNGDGASFTVTDSTGNALQIYPTNDDNYLLFYLVTNTDALYEFNSTNNSVSLIASNVVNQTPFEMVNFLGDVLTNSQEHYAIEMTLQFAQLDYSVPSDNYDYYKLQTVMTPRVQ